jgi:hypothetical protein
MSAGARNGARDWAMLRLVSRRIHTRRSIMLYTLAIVLLILWALGLVSSFTMGGFIHVLLVIAIVVVLLRVIGGRSPV